MQTLKREEISCPLQKKQKQKTTQILWEYYANILQDFSSIPSKNTYRNSMKEKMI